MLNSQQMTAKWKSGMQSAGPAYTAGTAAVTESPMAKAAQNLDKAAANYQRAISSGRMAAALNATPLATWKAGCQRGAANFATGVAKGEQKVAANFQRMVPIYDQMKQASRAAGGGQAGMIAAHQIIVAAGKRANG